MTGTASVVIGVDVATINLANGTTLLVQRGQSVPAGVAPEELARLHRVGVFDEQAAEHIAKRDAEHAERATPNQVAPGDWLR
jgi:hypothetical protein